jgi:predicted DNA-binding transcriptional regulator AlpA
VAELLTPQQLAQRLGISRSMVYARREDFPHVYIGSRLCFPEAAP